jgi:hypothetical protein
MNPMAFSLLGRCMLNRLARLLQIFGMILLPVAIAGNVADPGHMDLRTSLGLSALGVLVFLIGWSLQQKTRPP